MEEILKITASRQIDKKTSKQVRIDTGLHKLLKRMAVDEGTTIKGVLQGYLAELLAVKSDTK